MTDITIFVFVYANEFITVEVQVVHRQYEVFKNSPVSVTPNSGQFL